MSDSSCSNCSLLECKFRDWSYNCYIFDAKEFHKDVSKLEYQEIVKDNNFFVKLHKKLDIDETMSITNSLREMIEKYENGAEFIAEKTLDITNSE